MQIMTYIVPYSADKKHFQIQFGPVDYCLNWGVSYIIAGHADKYLLKDCSYAILGLGFGVLLV